MALNNSAEGIRALRRRLVAQLLLRGYTQREIRDALARPVRAGGLRNPQTGKPYSLGTINADVQHLRERWREEAAADIAEHKARHVAELGEVKRTAWKQKDLRTVLKALDQEAKVLALNAPLDVDLTSGGEPMRVTAVEVVKQVIPEGLKDERGSA